MFRKILSQTIRNTGYKPTEFPGIMAAALALKAPPMPPKLTYEQRSLKIVRALDNSVKNFSELECARILSGRPEISPDTLELVSQLIRFDKTNAFNPTRRELLTSVSDRVDECRPLEMFASLCLEKGPGLRDGTLEWFLKGNQLPTPQVLAKEASIKGWNQVREIVSQIDYPIEVTFLLGDLDYAVVDGCEDWCEAGWQEILSRDTDRILEETQEQANKFFGAEKNVKIKKWSSVYKAEEITQQLHRAEEILQNSSSSPLIRDSFEIYKRQWGYAKLAQKLGISEYQLESFILGDIQRMAAQYRVEANYVRDYNRIQLWCEAIPNPGWPIQLSNFDGSGYVASLIMV
jgi:hypothetical protein